MKKLVLLIFFIQVYSAEAQVKKGLKGGLNVANMSFGNEKENSRLGFYAGFAARVGFSKAVFVQPEILYSSKGFRYDTPTAAYKIGEIKLNYLSVPLMFGITAPGTKLSFMAGPEFGIMLRATQWEGTGGRKRTDFNERDISVNLGIAYKLFKGLGAELRYSSGTKGISTVTYTDVNGADIGTENIGKNRVVQLGFFVLL